MSIEMGRQPKTDPALLDRLIAAARNYRMTPAEVREQRVSFIYGQMGHKSGLSKDQIRAFVARHEGWDDCGDGGTSI